MKGKISVVESEVFCSIEWWVEFYKDYPQLKDKVYRVKIKSTTYPMIKVTDLVEDENELDRTKV